MNNKLEVIGIDHGWSMMKTISQVFVTGVKEITTTPALFGDVLEYEGKFYKVGTVRQEVKDTKVEDDSFYLLTLAAVAKELKRRGLAEAKVFLAVGLPLTRFGAEKNDFIKYLTKNKRVSFKYENESYHIEIDDVAVFPQCYAAVVDKIPTMAKGEFMLGLCEQCIGDSLNSRQKSIIDRCVRKMYIDIARGREKYIPVMSDFYDILMEQPEDEAKDIALSLELFVNGSLNIFNHQTNVDVDNRFTVYGIRDLGTELSPITMLVMMESIQNRIVENGQKGKATWLYIDEFHVLLNSEYSAKYLQQLWKKVRKQGGLCTGITQNVVDLLQNYTATTMLANSEFVALLKQANTDSSKMAEVIGVSEAQLRFVTNTASGMGLIKCGSVVIPFDNQISKDTDLYRLYNTNIHEKIAEQKKREAKFAD